MSTLKKQYVTLGKHTIQFTTKESQLKLPTQPKTRHIKSQPA